MPLSQNDLDWFAARLSIAVYDTKQEYRMARQTELRDKFNAPDLTVRFMGHFQIINLEGHEITIGSMATDEQIAAEIAKIRQITEKPTMSAIDRLKAKALEAKNVAPDAIKKFEADLDSILAAKSEIESKRVAAVSPHQEAIAGVKGELDGLKSAMDILSNG